jgi:hypothetical protein
MASTSAARRVIRWRGANNRATAARTFEAERRQLAVVMLSMPDRALTATVFPRHQSCGRSVPNGDRSLRRPRLEIARGQHASIDKKTDQLIR